MGMSKVWESDTPEGQRVPSGVLISGRFVHSTITAGSR